MNLISSPPGRSAHRLYSGRRGHEVGDESDRSPPGRFAHRLYTGRPHAFALPAAFRKSTNGRQEEKKPVRRNQANRPWMMRSLSWRATSTVAHFASTYMITNAQVTLPWAERG
jgi:hypothetical protein